MEITLTFSTPTIPKEGFIQIILQPGVTVPNRVINSGLS
jgi:hypothetical protein